MGMVHQPDICYIIAKVLDGNLAGHMSSILSAMEWAQKEGAQVFNLSIDGAKYAANANTLFDAVYQKGGLVVASGTWCTVIKVNGLVFLSFLSITYSHLTSIHLSLSLSSFLFTHIQPVMMDRVPIHTQHHTKALFPWRLSMRIGRELGSLRETIKLICLHRE